MRLQGRSGLLYGILVFMITTMGIWWMYFLSQEDENYQRYQMQRFATDRMHAHYLLSTVPEVAHNPTAMLKESFPHLIFTMGTTGTEVEIDPRAIAEVKQEASHRQRMFMFEGIFFLALLIAGTTILTLAHRRERHFEKVRELFLAGATHELKTPLASLRLYTETLNRDELPEAQRSRIRETMLEDVDRLEGMVDQVLAVSREEEQCRGPLEILDLGEFTQQTLDTMQAFLTTSNAVVEADLPSGHFVLGNIDAVAVIVRNLVRNAVVHSPQPAHIRIRLHADQGVHRLTISDNGPGIPRGERQKIFDSFYRIQTDEERASGQSKGTGLGLYLVKRNARIMNGSITVDSEPGQGAAFTLALQTSAPPQDGVST
jgi:signal transduction histidine kinase